MCFHNTSGFSILQDGMFHKKRAEILENNADRQIYMFCDMIFMLGGLWEACPFLLDTGSVTYGKEKEQKAA